jgi:uncharacterized protein
MTTTEHRDAAQALDEHLELIGRDTPRWLDLFADDAIVEFPYAPAGLPGRFEGKAAIEHYFRGALESFLGLVFSDVRRYRTTDPDVALAEAHGSATITTTGKRYEQDYVMVLRTRQGKVVHYREYWNIVPALEAFGGKEALDRAVNK